MRSNPIVQEALSVYGSAHEFRRAHVLVVSIAAAILFVLWPGDTFTSYFAFGDQPVVFPVAATVFPLALGLLCGNIGLNRISRRSFITELEWVTRTPLSVAELVTGKAMAGAAHSLFLVLLLAPVIVLAGTASGVSRADALYALLLTASFALAGRFLGLALIALFPRRTYIGTAIFWVLYLAVAFLSINRAPLIHPAVAILGTPGERGPWFGALPAWHLPWQTVGIHIASAALFLVIYACGILWLERRNRRHAGR